MRDMGSILFQTDFSKYTDLKGRLAKQLFHKQGNSKVVSFRPLSDEEISLVQAAGDFFKTKDNE